MDSGCETHPFTSIDAKLQPLYQNELSTVPAAAIPVSGEDEYVCDVMSPVLGVL